MLELREFDIHYYPRPSIKSQALADFIVKCLLPEEVKVEAEATVRIPTDDV